MEIIRYGENERHLFNQEENRTDPSHFLTLPPSPPLSIAPNKKQKHTLLPVSILKMGSLFLHKHKKRHHPHTTLVTGTIFGQKTVLEHLHLAIQMEPKSAPLVILELATSTKSFMNAIAEGPVQLFLSCVKKGTSMSIWEEWKWTEHSNGQVVGDALRLISAAMNLEFLQLIEHVTCGAGAIQDYEDRGVKGELMYLRAKFQKIKWSFDAESLFMVESANRGCTDISICFSRV